MKLFERIRTAWTLSRHYWMYGDLQFLMDMTEIWKKHLDRVRAIYISHIIEHGGGL